MTWPCAKCGASASKHLSVFVGTHFDRHVIAGFSIDDAPISEHSFKPALHNPLFDERRPA